MWKGSWTIHHQQGLLHGLSKWLRTSVMDAQCLEDNSPFFRTGLWQISSVSWKDPRVLNFNSFSHFLCNLFFRHPLCPPPPHSCGLSLEAMKQIQRFLSSPAEVVTNCWVEGGPLHQVSGIPYCFCHIGEATEKLSWPTGGNRRWNLWQWHPDPICLGSKVPAQFQDESIKFGKPFFLSLNSPGNYSAHSLSIRRIFSTSQHSHWT